MSADTVRARRIATLTDVPGFNELVEDLEAAEQRAWNGLLVSMKLGTPVDQRAVDEMRGVAKTIRLLKRGPEKAAKQLERAENQPKETDVDDRA